MIHSTSTDNIQSVTIIKAFYALNEESVSQNIINKLAIQKVMERVGFPKFLIVAKGHVPHLPSKGVHMLPHPPLHEVNKLHV